MRGITKKEGFLPKKILFATDPTMSVSITVANTDIVADTQGKKILKAGTPIAGDLTARQTAFTQAKTTDTASNAVGILLQDIDVTAGTENAALLIFGFVNLAKLDSEVIRLLDEPAKKALTGLTFLK